LDLQTLSYEDVLLIHNLLVEEFGRTGDPIFPPGVKSESLLQSAVGRQHTSSGKTVKYPDVFSNAATLTYGVCCDHPFHNGNKRTALVAMLAHLDKNKLSLFDVKQKDLYQMILSVANHTIAEKKKNSPVYRFRPSTDDEVQALTQWIKKRAKRITKGEKQVTYRQLRSLLGAYGYYLDNAKGNQIDIMKIVEEKKGLFSTKTVEVEKRVGNIPYPSDNAFVPLSVMKHVRKTCKLTAEDGVDSDAFYSEGAIIDSFINKYRGILRKLARK
jgi:death-on-curing protein